MTQTKYITSGGLAFSEDKDMEKLHHYSLKGWHVRDFKLIGYVLEKGESNDYIYSVDYRSLHEDEKEEYFELFSSAGWTHIASDDDIHLFRANAGTKPIYTDKDTSVEKYKQLSGFMKKLTIPLALFTVLTWVIALISSGMLKSIFTILAIILTVITVPATVTLIAAYSNKWKVEGKRGLVYVVKILPLLLLLTAVMMLIVVNGKSHTISALTYMIVGAIAGPTVIWIIMSLYKKVGKLKWK